MIDLHLHTNYSDGALSPEELVARAARRGLTSIAITDHDGLGGIPEALAAGERYGIEVIPGIELSAGLSGEEIASFAADRGIPWDAEVRDIFVHILGYGIDIRNEALVKAVEDIRRQRESRNEKLIEALGRIGYRISREDLAETGGRDYIGKPNFAMAFVKKGYVKTPMEAFAPGKYLRHPEARKVHREKVHAKKAISLINGAGGKAVLAHPFKIAFSGAKEDGYLERLPVLLALLQKWGLSGMECYYSSHTREQAELLVSMAEQRGLFITCGSDFHGVGYDPDLDIGTIWENKT